MPLIDNRGRLFGRVNLIDGIVVLVVLLLVPIAYTAFILFRAPTPSISAIEPATQVVQPNMRIKLRGEGLRPLLRAFIGDKPATAYLYENDQSVDVLFSNIPPGQYDLSLLDGVQEVLRVPNGVNIVVPAQPVTSRIVAAGMFVGLEQARVGQLAAGQRYGAEGNPDMEVLEVGPPRPDFRFVTANDVNVVLPLDGLLQVPALLRLRCAVSDVSCVSTGGPVEARRALNLPHASGPIRFVVDYLIPDGVGRPVEVTVRFYMNPESVSVVKSGDRDTTLSNVGKAARIESVGRADVETGSIARIGPDSAGASMERRVADRQAAFNAVLRMDVHESPYGARYRSQLVRIGGTFVFSGPNYVANGIIVSVRSLQNTSDAQ